MHQFFVCNEFNIYIFVKYLEQQNVKNIYIYIRILLKLMLWYLYPFVSFVHERVKEYHYVVDLSLNFFQWVNMLQQ